MSRSLALASIVGGIVLALGMLLIPFTADAATWAVTVGNDEADRVEVGGECGTLFAHYISGPVNPACESPAKDRSWMVAAGVIVAALGAWTLRQPGRSSRL